MRLVFSAAVLLAALAVPMVTSGAEEAETVSLVGEPVDIQCYMGGRSGEAHASCAVSCAEKGQPIGFLAFEDDGTERLYLVMGADRKPAKDYMAEYMGMEVTATGTVTKKNGMYILTVSEVSEEDDEDWFPSEGVGSGSIQNQ